MGYYVNALDGKNSSPKWKIQFVSYKKAHCTASAAKKPKKEWDIPKYRWADLGFNTAMNLDEARARASQLNAIEKSNAIECRQQQYVANRKRFEQEARAMFPHFFREQFESRYIFGRPGCPTQKASRAHWQAAQRMLHNLALDPTDWFDHAHEFYDYFVTKRLSLSYARKILRFANLWGFFLSRKIGKPFLPIPSPRGREKARLQEAYYAKSERQNLESNPITPGQLLAAKDKMKSPNYEWIYLSVWLGLRPKEVDQLLEEGMSRIEILPCGTQVIWIYQTKLTSIPHDRRWKPIPLIFKEQKCIVRLITKREFERPLGKTIKRYFGERTTLYGGRKGFTDLMLGRGQRLEDISQWIGHRSIERTWRNYKDQRILHFQRV